MSQFTVQIEGNIGCGKSTFLERFREQENFTVLEEPVEKWKNFKGHNLLDLAYKFGDKYRASFQLYTMKTLLENHTIQVKCVKVMERSFHSGNYVFKELLNECENLKVETQILDEWYEFLEKNNSKMLTPNLVVYLRTDPQIALNRTKERNRSKESTIDLDFIQKVHDLHEKWLRNDRNNLNYEIYEINANKNKEELSSEFEKLLAYINVKANMN